MIDLKIGEYYTYKTGHFEKYDKEDIRQNPWMQMEDGKPRKLLATFKKDNLMPEQASCSFEGIENGMCYFYAEEYLKHHSFLKEKIDKILEK